MADRHNHKHPGHDSSHGHESSGEGHGQAHHDHGHDTHHGIGDGGGHGAHDHHEGHSPEMFRDKFWLSLILTIPVVFWSDHIQELFGYRAPEFPGSEWIPPILGTFILSAGGWLFLQGARHEIQARLPGMMTLKIG